MKLIAHRGNLNGPDLEQENNPAHIDEVIRCGFDCEIDLRWENNNFYLGHDNSQYKVSISWLYDRMDKLWIHCKNLQALELILSEPFNYNCFWHQEDDYTLTSHGIIWAYPGKKISKKSVVVMPELNYSESITSEYFDCYGICTDYPIRFRSF